MVGKVWSEEELKVLQDNPILEKEQYYEKGVDENRSWLQIRRKLRDFNKLLNRKWSKDEDKFLLENTNLKYIMKNLNRSKQAILQRAIKLGVGWGHFDECGNNRRWLDKEDKILKEQYNQDSINIINIAKKLNRSHKAVVNRASYLGIARKREDMSYLFK